ncbi:MAG: hypothetical protein GEV11_17460 [Streptosporangiales bacterium]|nr:hypothetical protein [Streptosporangiales bacterium]
METQESPELPGKTDAAAALRAAEEARRAGQAPIPFWFFPALGVAMGAMTFDMAPRIPFDYVFVAAGLLVLLLIHRLYYRAAKRSGITPRTLSTARGALFAAPWPVFWVAGWIFGDTLPWLPAATALAGLVWATGYGAVHNRRVRQAA